MQHPRRMTTIDNCLGICLRGKEFQYRGQRLMPSANSQHERVHDSISLCMPCTLRLSETAKQAQFLGQRSELLFATVAEERILSLVRSNWEGPARDCRCRCRCIAETHRFRARGFRLRTLDVQISLALLQPLQLGLQGIRLHSQLLDNVNARVARKSFAGG